MRSRNVYRKTIHITAIVILAALSVASSAAPDRKSGRVLRYSIREGLSFGIVNSIVQDGKGLMWFATDDGLNRFDGNSFKVFKFNSDDSASISGNYVKSLFRDRDGTIWASSRNGLNEFVAKKEQFVRYKTSTNKNGAPNDVSHISQGKGDNLWLSLNGSGFASFNKKTKRFKYFNTNTLPALTNNSILNVLEDSQGLLWLGTRDSGIEVLKTGPTGQLTRTQIDLSGIPQARVNSIYEDHFHNIWIATAKGLILYKRDVSKFFVLHINTFFGSNIYLSMQEDHTGKLLIGVQDGGIYSFDLAQLKQTKPADFRFEQVRDSRNEGITQRSVQSLYMDKDHNIWLGTYGEGVYLISSIPEKFQHFETRIIDSRANSYLRYYGMLTDADGALWLGTDGDGIYKTKSSGEVIRHYKADGGKGNITDGAVISAYRDKDNRLWFGTYSGGIFMYDKKTDKFRQFAHDALNPKSLPKNDVRAIFQDSKKNIWVGTNGGGLNLLNETTGAVTSYVPSNSSINSNDVRAITEDKYGNLWIGTYGGGLNKLDTRNMQFSSYFNDPAKANYLSNHIIFSLYIDSLQRLWIGSEGNGLLLYDIPGKTTRLFNDKIGLANNVINAIQQESLNKIWVSTNKGLSRISLPAGEIENFDQSNGLQAGQFNPNSVLKSEKDGFIAFGGTEGWNLFDPRQVSASSYQPKVMVTGIQLFGKNVEIGSETDGEVILNEQIDEKSQVTLQPNQSVFTIRYTALNYAYPERNKFAYMLEGLDKDWNYVGNEHFATYRYLPAGDYIFKVKVANQDGVWFNEYASLHVTILPPWYQTWWAYLLYISASGLLIYYYQQYKIRQAKLKYEIQLAHFETQNEKELNEKKLSFFTHVSHEFRTPLTLIINPVKELLGTNSSADDSASLNIVYRNAKRLLSLVDQLLLFRKTGQETDQLSLGTHNLPQLAREVFHYFVHQAEQKRINYQFVCDNEDLTITGDWEKIEIAMFNLVSNALKFTPENGTVTVTIFDRKDQVEIKVEDSGPGIPEHAGQKIFNVFHQHADARFQSKGGFGIGLYLAKTFVENHFGSLTFDSVLNEGTIFKMLLWKEHPDLTPDPDKTQSDHASILLEELSEGAVQDIGNLLILNGQPVMEELSADMHTLLIIDDDADIRQYLAQIFTGRYKLLEAESGEEGLATVKKHLPDIVISDVMMSGMSGIDMCREMKATDATSHIPVVLLTAGTSQENKLKGIEGGADDYISKPFDKELLLARVAAILKNRNDLQKYFYNEITLQKNDFKISPEYREFLHTCIQIVENHLTDPGFNIKVLASEIGMSHSTLYNRIKSISGQSTNSFIRFIRLRRAAEILITTDTTIAETAYQVGINDIKYFREQFSKLFGMKPSEYVKKYRKPFHENQLLNREVFNNKTG